ncbi:MAG TPA: DUF421 domain-containing protein [Clostridia bacterium]|nr:DUF421 domain-containing protein [Clostridia bacterium]
MLVLFVRVLILYLLIFFVLRITGKRQLGELQPFDLVMTLLIADLASVPASNTGEPLIYGVVPILALFLLQQLVSFLSLKSDGVRKLVCGQSVLLISRGVVQEEALRASRYTINDLMEQLRSKNAFTISDVEFAILETNGDVSVLLKGGKQQPDYTAFSLPPPKAAPPYMLVQDGRLRPEELRKSGRNEAWLTKKLAAVGCRRPADAFFAFLDCDGTLHVQTKAKLGARPYYIKFDPNEEMSACAPKPSAR